MAIESFRRRSDGGLPKTEKEKTMTSRNIRIALAAVLATLSAPAFAGDSTASAISGDPTWPAIENPAPAVVLHARGGEVQALDADPLFPETDNAAPAVALVAVPDDGRPEFEPAEGWETPSFAVVLPSAPKATEQLAAAK